MKILLYLLGGPLLALVPVSAFEPGSVVAFSLRAATTCVAAGTEAEEIAGLAGITRLAGFVYESNRQDVILIGRVSPEAPGIAMGDLVTGLKTRLIHNEWPLVSIDPGPETERDGQQAVRLEGHIAGVQWGEDFVRADAELKMHSLKLLHATLPVRSYREYLEEDLRTQVQSSGSEMLGVRWLSRPAGQEAAAARKGQAVRLALSSRCRFWFYPAERPRFFLRDSVFCIRDLHLAVRAEEMPQTNPFQPASSAGKRYAEEFSRSMESVSASGPLSRLKRLFDIVAVAEGIRNLGCQAAVTQLLKDYPVPRVATPTRYPLEELIGVVQRADGQPQLVRMSGGIDFRTDIEFLNHGDVSPLRKIVLSTRPGPGTLAWALPLGAWNMPNAEGLSVRAPQSSGTVVSPAAPGCWIGSESVQFAPRATPHVTGLPAFTGFSPIEAPRPLSGVSFKMAIADALFHPDRAGDLPDLEWDVLQSRPAENSLFWKSP